MYYLSGNIETSKIKINGQLLSPKHSQKVINHSPDGFSWSYSGSGPAQLALAILLTATDEENAVRLHQTFKEDFVARFPKRNFSKKIFIRKWLVSHNAPYIKSEDDFTTYIQSEKDEIGRKCGQQCTHAITDECNCSCGGENHGTEAVRT